MTTETTGHSPGPWTLGEIVQNDGSRAVVAADGSRVARVDGFADPKREWYARAVGNANLVVSAPEMVATVQRLVNNHCPREGTFCSECTPARALLRRIEGE